MDSFAGVKTDPHLYGLGRMPAVVVVKPRVEYRARIRRPCAPIEGDHETVADGLDLLTGCFSSCCRTIVVRVHDRVGGLSPWCWRRPVEPTTSVNNTVTVVVSVMASDYPRCSWRT